MKHLFSRCVLLTAALLLLGGLAFGQMGQTYGRVEGSVKDQTGGVIPGVTVTITGVAGAKDMVTGDSGEFAFPFLTPGQYDVKAELQGFKTYEQKNVVVRLGTTTTLALVITPGEISEVVTVKDQAPLVDVTSTTVGANISDDLYTSIPMRRNFTAIFNLAPGVSDGGGTGASNPSIGGASGLENNYVVDGVNVTNAGYGSLGAYSNVYGSLGSGVNFDFVQEVQIKSGGFEAEYGQSTGGVVNVITKSGGNEFHGGVYFYASPSGWAARRKQINLYREQKNTMVLARQAYDISGDLSGYVWKDKLFFYFGFNPQWNKTYRRAPDGMGQLIDGLAIYEQKERIYSWSGKLTFIASSNHNFEFSSFADPSYTGTGPNRGMTSEGDIRYSKLNYGSWNWIGRYNGVINPKWFITASLGRAFNRFNESFLYSEAYPFRNYIDYYYDYYLPTHPGAAPGNYSYFVDGGPGFYENNEGQNYQFNIKNTVNFNLVGEHSLDIGYLYEDVKYDAIRQYTGPRVVVPAYAGFPGGTTNGASCYFQWIRLASGNIWDRNGDGVINRDDAVFRQIRGNVTPPAVATTTKYHSFYFQDAWKISSKITFKYGLRYDYQKMAGSGAEAISYAFKGNWAPRFGLIYDVYGDGKMKIYGSWGKFYEKVPNDICVRAMSSETGVTTAFWGDPALTQFLNPALAAAGYAPANTLSITGSHPTYIVPGTDTGSTYQFVLGVDRQLTPTLSLGARFIWSTIGKCLEDVSGGTAQMGYDGFPTDYVIANPTYAGDIFINATGVLGSDGLPDGFADVERSYQALEVTLEKRFSNGFQFMANYRLSKLWGNYEGLFRNDNGQDDPNITSLYDFRDGPEINPDTGMKWLGYQFVPGYLNTDRRHIFNFNGSYTFPQKITVGAGVRCTSGAPITPLGTHPVYQNDGEIPMTPRGSAGRGAWVNTVDLHCDYPWQVTDSVRVRFAIDLFNVFNRRQPTTYDENIQQSFETNVDYLTALSFQAPFSARASVRVEF
ncbi:MAG: TonB-dependent receptor [Acidobacteria bacterium]|nr:TonB-dependent receptor [Acidobacteriota bacterium]